jgi:hypothetical protein
VFLTTWQLDSNCSLNLTEFLPQCPLIVRPRKDQGVFGDDLFEVLDQRLSELA